MFCSKRTSLHPAVTVRTLGPHGHRACLRLNRGGYEVQGPKTNRVSSRRYLRDPARLRSDPQTQSCMCRLCPVETASWFHTEGPNIVALRHEWTVNRGKRFISQWTTKGRSFLQQLSLCSGLPVENCIMGFLLNFNTYYCLFNVQTHTQTTATLLVFILLLNCDGIEKVDECVVMAWEKYYITELFTITFIYCYFEMLLLLYSLSCWKYICFTLFTLLTGNFLKKAKNLSLE